VGSTSNFVVYSGLPKTGKTTFISALLSSSIHPGEFFGMKLHLPAGRNRIAYFDTESSEYDHYRTIERIKNFTTFNRLPDNLDTYILRQDNHITIMRYIEEYLKAFPDCAVMVLDGLLDLILNYNSEEECRILIQFIKRITAQFNILLVTVLHLGKKDKETLGHLGSASDRYAQSTLIIEKDKDQQTYNLSPKFMRSDSDFETVSIKNFQGVWHEVAYEAPASEQMKRKPKTK
jgi:KaiC/GvpD/RAD55 family RecA-like ATPase